MSSHPHGVRRGMARKKPLTLPGGPQKDHPKAGSHPAKTTARKRGRPPGRSRQGPVSKKRRRAGASEAATAQALFAEGPTLWRRVGQQGRRPKRRASSQGWAEPQAQVWRRPERSPERTANAAEGERGRGSAGLRLRPTYRLHFASPERSEGTGRKVTRWGAPRPTGAGVGSQRAPSLQG